MNMKKETIKLVAILFSFCAIGALILASLNSVTAPRIKALEKEKTDKALVEVFPDGGDFQEIELDGSNESIAEAYTVMSGGSEVGKCVLVDSQGFGGAIRMMVGVTNEGAVTGVSIVSMNETPGLGTKADDAEWLSQFALKTSPISVVKGQATAENEIVAVSGATVTSKAVTAGVETAIAFAGGAN